MLPSHVFVDNAEFDGLSREQNYNINGVLFSLHYLLTANTADPLSYPDSNFGGAFAVTVKYKRKKAGRVYPLQ